MGLVSSQFHVVSDNKFATVPYLSLSESVHPDWTALNEHSTKIATDDQSHLAVILLSPNIAVQDQLAIILTNETNADTIPAPGGAISIISQHNDPHIDDNQTSESMGER